MTHQDPGSSEPGQDQPPKSGTAVPSPSAEPPAELPAPPVDLGVLAVTIKEEWDQVHGAHGRAIDHCLRIGHALLTARSRCPADREFGEWFRSQDFGFSTEWGRQLRFAAKHEDLVRAWWHQELEAGRNPSLRRCLASLAPKTSNPKTPTVATRVATNSYPESERRKLLEEPLALHSRRGERAIECANGLEQSLRAWEDQQTPALHDVLADRLPERDAGEIENIVAEILAVLRGE